MFGVAALRAGPYPGQSASDPLADEWLGTMAEPDAPGVPRMVRGTVVTHRRRCGKPGCRCAAGEQLHESVVLSYSERGRTRFVMLPPGEVAAFAASAGRFSEITGWLDGDEAAALAHAELEEQLGSRGRELTRALFQDHLDLRAVREQRRGQVAGADGVTRTRAEAGHARPLATVFGEVTVSRIAYRAPGASNLHPADAELNLPEEKHSHGLRKLAAAEAPRGSFEAAGEAITRATGVTVGKRQVEQLARAAAADIDAFYAARRPGR